MEPNKEKCQGGNPFALVNQDYTVYSHWGKEPSFWDLKVFIPKITTHLMIEGEASVSYSSMTDYSHCFLIKNFMKKITNNLKEGLT